LRAQQRTGLPIFSGDKNLTQHEPPGRIVRTRPHRLQLSKKDWVRDMEVAILVVVFIVALILVYMIH
jgi:hypothetical protein